MPFNLGLGEVLVVLVVALIVFGGRLPQVGHSLGRGLREFRKGLKGQAAPAEEEVPASTPSGDEPERDKTVEAEAGEETEATPRRPDSSP